MLLEPHRCRTFALVGQRADREIGEQRSVHILAQ
jgi:hypothetical protein